MKNKILVSLLLGVFLIGTISAMSISFYHSNNCGYCQKIKPFVMEQVNKYPTFIWGIYEISNDENNYASFINEGFEAVPAFIIKTDDCREIKFIGADEIKLKCEIEQMTTLECPTYSPDEYKGGSFFLE